MNKKSILAILVALVLSVGNAVAEEDVQALVVDNGSTVSVPETSTFSLLLAGLVGVGLVAYRNRKK